MLMKNDPNIALNRIKIEEMTQKFIDQHSNERVVGVITIPVVVHVVYKQGFQNISDAQVLSQMTALNDDFRRTNGDAGNTPGQWTGIAADVEIDFCLASTDPDGNSTSGITRTHTNKQSFSYVTDFVKFTSQGGHDAWPRENYLNIWVCNLAQNSGIGYAQFPGGPAATDGIVIDYQAFGTVGTAQAPFHLGRTATHEVGHWINLFHIWGDGPCGLDDLVGDTPESDAPNYGCNQNHFSCSTLDMVQNYMDYSDDNCMNLFTDGQSTRMRAMFDAGAFRESLLNSNGCGGGTTPPPCTIPAGLNASNIVDDQATLNWGSVTGATSYNIRAREEGTTTWAIGSTTNTAINYINLMSCTDYEFQVEAVCSASSSDFSGSSTFTTTGCTGGTCETPTGLFTSNIAKKKARLNWNAVSGAASYNAQYRPVGSSNWSTKTTSNTSTNLGGLSSGTTYEWHVRSVCSGTQSAYSGLENFTTPASRLGEFSEDISIYPNPANDHLTLQFGSLEGAINILITDVVGKVVENIIVPQSEHRLEIATQHYGEGIYFVVLRDDNGAREVMKVVIQR